MAISKQNLLESLTAEQERIVADYEQRIDRTLQERYDGTPVWIRISPPTNTRVRDELQKRYRAAGWNLRYEHDQRDGSAIVLS